MKQFKPNNMMLQVSTRIIALIIITFSVYLFLAGHNEPGGGFIGGLMTASGILVLYLAFDVKIITKSIPFNFPAMVGVGLVFAVSTGMISIFLGEPFLTQFFGYFQFFNFGAVELTTALLFDLGVYLVVVGSALTIILAIAEDDN